MSALCIGRLPPWANVPAQRTWWMNAFTAMTGDKTAMQLLPDYFGHLFGVSHFIIM